MSYTKLEVDAYLATNGVEYYGWVGRHILDPDGYYSSKSEQQTSENTTNVSPETKVRRCLNCWKRKPLSEFPKSSFYSLTHKRTCRECAEKITKKMDKVYLRVYRRNYLKNKRSTDPIYLLSSRIRSRIRHSIKTKRLSTIEMLGCTGQEAFEYLVNQFTPDMSLDDFMEGRIHIDHIRPVSSFDLTNEDELRECFHYTNLQPLWAQENLRKGAKWGDLY